MQSREEYLARKKRWREQNKEKVKVQRAAWKKANWESHCASSRKWFANNKERARAATKNWELRNPERVKFNRRVREARRRARKRGSNEAYTLADVRQKWDFQKGLCFYCSDSLVDYHIDHFVPLFQGGSNGAANIVIACPPCNLIKGHRMPDDPAVWRDITANKASAT